MRGSWEAHEGFMRGLWGVHKMLMRVHEGFMSYELWLAVQQKTAGNIDYYNILYILYKKSLENCCGSFLPPPYPLWPLKWPPMNPNTPANPTLPEIESLSLYLVTGLLNQSNPGWMDLQIIRDTSSSFFIFHFFESIILIFSQEKVFCGKINVGTNIDPWWF